MEINIADLLEKYPFLLYRNYKDNPIYEKGTEEYYNHNYWTAWDGNGWESIWKDFLLKIMKIYDESNDIEFKDNFRILDTKEKYGSLRVDLYPHNDDIFKNEIAVELVSSYTCYVCGKQPRNSKGTRIIWTSKGYILPFCKNCAKNDLGIYNKNWKKYFNREVNTKGFRTESYKDGKTTIHEYKELN